MSTNRDRISNGNNLIGASPIHKNLLLIDKENLHRNYETFGSKTNLSARISHHKSKIFQGPTKGLRASEKNLKNLEYDSKWRSKDTNRNLKENNDTKRSLRSQKNIHNFNSKTAVHFSSISKPEVKFSLTNFLDNRDSEKLHIKIKEIEKIASTSDGQYLIMGGKGLHVLDMSSDNFKLVRYDKEKSKLFINRYLFQFYQNIKE